VVPSGAEFEGPLLERVLHARSLDQEPARTAFLGALRADPHPAAALPGVDQAAERIEQALAAAKHIVVYGDYDVDGVSSTAILVRVLRAIGGGATVEAYLPHRMEEGYGLNAAALTSLRDAGASLVITVDCGASACEEASHARAIGLDLIVTDHHPVDPAIVPEVAALVHPAPSGSDYPWPDLSGSAVAWKLARHLVARHLGSDVLSGRWRPLMQDMLCLAGLGIVADVVPLTGENRRLASKALHLMRGSRLAGVQAMLTSCLKRGERVESESVGYRIGPRLNAVGRLGHAQEALDLLMSDDPDTAAQLAARLDKVNAERQELVRAIEAEACAMVDAEGMAGDSSRLIMLANPSWHPGVVGIVCSRLVDRYHRPTVLLGGGGDGQLRGSARSIDGYAINDAVLAAAAAGLSGGGHAMAAGMGVSAADFEAARELMMAHAEREIDPSRLRPRIDIDCEISLSALTRSEVQSLDVLRPFGRGNPKPVFLIKGERVDEGKPMGSGGAHAAFRLEGGIRAVWWHTGHRVDDFPRGVHVDLVAHAQINEWQGRSSVELSIVDMRRASLG